MIKRKFGDAVRAKTDMAMRNEGVPKSSATTSLLRHRVVRTEHRPVEVDAGEQADRRRRAV